MKGAKLTLAVAATMALLGSFGAGGALAAFGISNFSVKYQDPYAPGAAQLQAASHADVVTRIDFNEAAGLPEGQVRDIEVRLPAGFSGNPQALPSCSFLDLVLGDGFCNPAAQVGSLLLTPGDGSAPALFPVYNLAAPDAQTAVLGVVAVSVPAKIVVSARTDDDYGLTTNLTNINQGLALGRLTLTIWGAPAEPVHDPQRLVCTHELCGNNPAGIPAKPFLSLPGRCEPMINELKVDSWQDPGVWHYAADETPALTGCDRLDFAPTLRTRPTTNAADSPSGLDVDVELRQNLDDPTGLSPANYRTVETTLPEGLVLNPSAANGLKACTPQQIGFIGKSNERQLLRVKAPGDGFFSASFGGATTAPIPATAGVAEVTHELEGLPGLAGNISLVKAPGGWIITYGGPLAATDVPAIGGTVTGNAGQSLDVTGEGGGFNLYAGGVGTGATFEATTYSGLGYLEFTNANRVLHVGELVEGPGFPAGTVLTEVFENSAVTNNAATADQTGAHLSTALPFDVSAAALQDALQAIPALGAGNVLVNSTGTSGMTRSYQMVFVGGLAGTSPTLTATNSLTGPGAGVTLSSQPPAAPQPLQVSTVTKAGTPHYDKAPVNCPDASRIGSAEVDIPALADPLKGGVYAMTPFDNPFGSFLGFYFAAEGHGILSKIPVKVSADPQTGRLVSTVEESPQIPIEIVRLKLNGGATAVLRTPPGCGNYATTAVLSPWSAPDTPTVTARDEYAIEKGPNGSACGGRPNSPSFEAGSMAPLAGQYKPFTVNLRREDGTQEFSAVTINPPPGLVAKLKGTAICSDGALAAAAGKSGAGEKANPSCPAASEIGHVYTAAGAGPAPYNAPGLAYLAGPYKGAPLSFAVVTPGTAGPFDLGTIVVRAAAYIDPKTAQVTVKSDPVPEILKGIPLDVRSVSIRLDKPEFTLNPTSCDPSDVTGSLLSTQGNSAALKSRFQLAECGRLGFKPALKLSLKGGTKRGEYPALTATLTNRPGDANISSVQVALPHSEFLAQNHIRTICTRVQFAADSCPAASIYGKVSVVTPILDYPLTGPVYLRASANPLPDLVPDLHGPAYQPIRFESAGKTDSVKGGLRNTFSFVPDVPFGKLTLQLQGGKKGLLQNSRNICASTNKADASYTAHNGATYAAKPVLKSVSCKKGKKKKGPAKKGKAHGKRG